MRAGECHMRIGGKVVSRWRRSFVGFFCHNVALSKLYFELLEKALLLISYDVSAAFGVLTVKDWLHLSAAILLLAKAFKASLPALAFAKISSDPGLVGFSSTKKASDNIAKKVVYIVNQYAPMSRPRRCISAVICTIFLETLTQAAAQA